jgi:hypothetical protein
MHPDNYLDNSNTSNCGHLRHVMLQDDDVVTEEGKQYRRVEISHSPKGIEGFDGSYVALGTANDLTLSRSRTAR